MTAALWRLANVTLRPPMTNIWETYLDSRAASGGNVPNHLVHLFVHCYSFHSHPQTIPIVLWVVHLPELNPLLSAAMNHAVGQQLSARFFRSAHSGVKLHQRRAKEREWLGAINCLLCKIAVEETEVRSRGHHLFHASAPKSLTSPRPCSLRDNKQRNNSWREMGRATVSSVVTIHLIMHLSKDSLLFYWKKRRAFTGSVSTCAFRAHRKPVKRSYHSEMTCESNAERSSW